MGWTGRYPWARMQWVVVPVPPRRGWSPLTLSQVEDSWAREPCTGLLCWVKMERGIAFSATRPHRSEAKRSHLAGRWRLVRGQLWGRIQGARDPSRCSEQWGCIWREAVARTESWDGKMRGELLPGAPWGLEEGITRCWRTVSSVPVTWELPRSACPQLLSKANIRHFPSDTAFFGCQISLPFVQARASVHMFLLNCTSLPKPQTLSSRWQKQIRDRGRQAVSRTAFPLLPCPSECQQPKYSLCTATGNESSLACSPAPCWSCCFPLEKGMAWQSHLPGSRRHPKTRGWDSATEGWCWPRTSKSRQGTQGSTAPDE